MIEQLTVLESIQELARLHAQASSSDEDIFRFLRSWWSRTYNRPLKDPILASYTLHELAYEFFDHKERDAYAERARDEEADKIEQEKHDEATKWADEQERLEKELLEKEHEQLDAQSAANAEPTVTESDAEWMEQQLQAERERYGESFGEDIAEEF